MSIGFFETDVTCEQHNLHEESFWPSFTDIMMVIVMVFLLVVVSVILNNYQLVKNLKQSMLAQQLASSIAQDTQIKNNDLEEHIQELKQQLNEKTARFTTLEQQSKEQLDIKNKEIFKLKQQKKNYQNKIADLEAQIKSLRNSLTENASEYIALQKELTEKSSEIEILQQTLTEQSTEFSELKRQRQSDEIQLLSLQGELDSLGKKYQKLLRPARSPKGKFVVTVRYTKYKGRDIYRLRTHPRGEYKNVSRWQLEHKMAKLKKKHGDHLYVKVVIPKNSGLSYNEALKFTNFMQKSYDYYFQDEQEDKTDQNE